MHVNFTARHMDISDSLKQHTYDKMAKLQKYMEMIDADVTFTLEKYRHKVEVRLKSKKGHVTGTEVSNDMYQSIDRVFDKLEKQLRRRKDRIINQLRSKSHSETDTFLIGADSAGESDSIDASTIVWEEVVDDIVESEVYETKPMTPEEAIMQFKLLDSDFYVFKNKHHEETINIIYRRHDGKIGLIRTQ
jgi:putative sigma-54 modulation protein